MFQKWWQAVLLAVALTLFLLGWHYLLPSMLSGYDTAGLSSEKIISEAVRIHQVDIAFVRRPLSTWCIQFLAQYSGFSVAQSFIILNFTVIFFCNILIYVLAKLYLCSQREALASQIIFASSFSVLFAFFAPVYTYDDPLQYLFILLSLVAIHFRSSLLVVPFLFLALIAGETTFFLFLAFYALHIPQKVREQSFEALEEMGMTDEELEGVTPVNMWVLDFTALIPLALATIFYIYFVNTYFEGVQIESDSMWFWLENFQSVQFATETFVTGLMVLGLPLTIIMSDIIEDKHAVIIRNFLFAMLINTIAVVIMTKAREARLFALPLVLYFPIAGQLFFNVIKQLNFKAIKFKFYFAIAIIIAAVFSFTMYYSTDSGGANRYYQLYLFISLALSMFIIHNIDYKLNDYLPNNDDSNDNDELSDFKTIS